MIKGSAEWLAMRHDEAKRMGYRFIPQNTASIYLTWKEQMALRDAFRKQTDTDLDMVPTNPKPPNFEWGMPMAAFRDAMYAHDRGERPMPPTTPKPSKAR